MPEHPTIPRAVYNSLTGFAILGVILTAAVVQYIRTGKWPI